MSNESENKQPAALSSTDLVTRLEAGWLLRNRGCGWWVEAPEIPYKKTPSDRVEDGMVDKLEADGVIECELLTRSYVGRLADGSATNEMRDRTETGETKSQ